MVLRLFRQERILNSMSRSPNSLLASLSYADFELLRPHLQTVDLMSEDLLCRAGDALERVYFPHSGVISLVVCLTSGGAIEAASMGKDSVFGAHAALDGRMTHSDAIVHLSGVASAVDITDIAGAVAQSSPLRSTLIRHERALFAQAQQSAACNASHTVEARLSRWLLRMRDLSGNDTFELTQEFLAQMIGMRRSSVPIVAYTLQRAGLLRYRHGMIEITNLDGLVDSSCECYEAVKAQYDRLLYPEQSGRGAGRPSS